MRGIHRSTPHTRHPFGRKDKPSTWVNNPAQYTPAILLSKNLLNVFMD